MSHSHWTQPPPTYDYSTTTLTPYLQLPHLLSLTWLAYPIISLAFIAFRLHLSLASADGAIANAKNNLLASCKAAETAATSAASMPRYLAIASNEQFVDAVNGSLNAARETLILALTVMEAVINFIIDLYRSTLLCFLELIVRGAFALLIGAVNELNNVVNSIASGLSSSIRNDISAANSAIQTAIDGINKVNPFGDIKAPQIPVPDLSALQNVTLPDSFTKSLSDLNSSLPTVAQLKNEIETIIDKPFELLKKDINDTFAAISFNSSILPVPQQNNVLFCDNMDVSVVDDLGKDIISTARIGFIILVLLALLMIAGNCLLEWYKWRCLKQHLAYTRQAWMSDPTLIHAKTAGTPTLTMNDHNLMLLNANSAHPLLTRITNNMSQRLHLSPSQHTHLQWFFHYVFHPPALACLLIGLLGLLSVELQLLAIGPLVAKYQERSTATASNFSNLIATSINDSMYNQSSAYANGVNAQVDLVQNTLNNGVFGWVNVTTTTLNSTVNTFYDDVQKVVNGVFGGTIFESPAQEFVKCFIGSKVDAIENALTFLHDNLVVNMPRVNQTALVLSPDSVNEVTTPIAAAAIGGGSDGKEGLIEKIVNSYAASLRKERLMFGIFIGLWGIVVLMALLIIFWHAYGRGRVEDWKREKFEKEQRALVVPFGMGGSSDKAGLAPHPTKYGDLPSFTPMPSPGPTGAGNTFLKPFAFGFGSSRAPSPVPNEASQMAGGASFRERFASGQPSRRKSLRGQEMPSAGSADLGRQPGEVVRNLPPSTWVKRIRSLSASKKKERPPPLPVLRIDSDSGDEIVGNHDEEGEKSRWSASPNPSPNAVSSPWKLHNLRKKTPPSVGSASPATPSSSNTLALPVVVIGPAPPSRRQPPPKPVQPLPSDVDLRSSQESQNQLPPPPPPRREPQRDMTLDELLPPPFAAPLHLGFDDSRYPKLNNSQSAAATPASSSSNNVYQIQEQEQYLRTRSPTPVPGPVAVAIKSPRQLQFHQIMNGSNPPSSMRQTHQRTTSVPMSISVSASPITRLLTRVGRPMSATNDDDEVVNPFVTPFDDEHRVEIESPVNTRKSMKTNPFEDGRAF